MIGIKNPGIPAELSNPVISGLAASNIGITGLKINRTLVSKSQVRYFHSQVIAYNETRQLFVRRLIHIC